LAHAARELEQHWTWADYQTWSDDQRWEIISGQAFAMTPSPTFRHQRIVIGLALQMESFFAERNCQLVTAPMDVRLSDQDVVQPDLLVICDPSRVKEGRIVGPPTLVVEVLSPWTERHDRVRKMRLYAEYGVKEYWIVTPYPHLVEIFVLAAKAYRFWNGYGKEDILTCAAFPELRLRLDRVFSFPLEPGEEVQEVRETTPPYPARTERTDAAAGGVIPA
jgi:Uma2 family endonuclease